ncbi:shikimate dehydrogenase [Pelagicoccus albus]|uniref:Shikimate dehydrogenase (NADP(+)) n=1 Tax=Pelagicoccus albus TaxID=415222 RepID=A0A7X1B6J2_9BACT|nr:shikimate dehydrogenase [Pelagicoccus albus]MBC2606566.1 shikimate dehydrogenase [Pelagicoccus albus]
MPDTSADITYTLENLTDWSRSGPSLAVIGNPVRHSISPQMHNAAIAKLAEKDERFSNWKYFRFEIPAELLIESLPIFREKGFLGLNLTVPHKEIAVPATAEIDPLAKTIGAVNTLQKTENGWKGFNTDGYGLAQGIKISLSKEIAHSDFVLLGAGGAARAAAIQAIHYGCATLTIVNRNQERLGKLVNELRPLAEKSGVELRSLSPQSIDELHSDCLLVNATSLGLKPDDPTPIPESKIPENAYCFDMIYNPPTTKLMEIVRLKGGTTANGLGMLVHQGAKALSIWTGQDAPSEIMQEAAEAALAKH